MHNPHDIHTRPLTQVLKSSQNTMESPLLFLYSSFQALISFFFLFYFFNNTIDFAQFSYLVLNKLFNIDPDGTWHSTLHHLH